MQSDSTVMMRSYTTTIRSGMHTSVSPPPSFGIIPDQSFEEYNEEFERFLKQAYDPSVPTWIPVGEEQSLREYLAPEVLETNERTRHFLIRLALAVSVLYLTEKPLEVWDKLPLATRKSHLLDGFRELAWKSDLFRSKIEPRIHTPELNLESLLSGTPDGFSRLAYTLYLHDPPGKRVEKVSTVGCPEWERLMGMPEVGDGIPASKARLAYIDRGILERHLVLYQFVRCVFLVTVSSTLPILLRNLGRPH
jgi:hypothetical protein